MKKLIFTLSALTLSVFSLVAQVEEKSVSSTQPKNEIGMNLFSITNAQGIFYKSTSQNTLLDSYNPQYNFASGIYYKRFYGNNGIRTSFDYFQRAESQSQSFGQGYFSSYSGTKKTSEIKIGYEHKFGNRKLVPFVFTDVVFGYSQMKGFRSYYGDFASAENAPYYFERYSCGLAGGGGIKYHVTKNITLTYEFSLQGGYYQEKDLLIPKNRRDNYWQFSYAFNPVRQLGLSITF